MRPQPNLNGAWIALDAERADRLFEVGLAIVPGRVTIAQDEGGVKLSATHPAAGTIEVAYRLDGAPTINEGLLRSSIESRASMNDGRLIVDNYRGGTWVWQMRLWIQGDQLTIEMRSASNVVTTIYRKAF